MGWLLAGSFHLNLLEGQMGEHFRIPKELREDVLQFGCACLLLTFGGETLGPCGPPLAVWAGVQAGTLAEPCNVRREPADSEHWHIEREDYLPSGWDSRFTVSPALSGEMIPGSETLSEVAAGAELIENAERALAECVRQMRKS